MLPSFMSSNIGVLMKCFALILAFGLTLPGLAFADCPKGTNVKLTDTTTSLTVQQNDQSGATGQNSGSNSQKGVKNHWPH